MTLEIVVTVEPLWTVIKEMTFGADKTMVTVMIVEIFVTVETVVTIETLVTMGTMVTVEKVISVEQDMTLVIVLKGL